MPPAFIMRISFSSSALLTPGPNHHQRIMMRASSGGFWKEDRKVAMGPALRGVARSTASATSETRFEDIAPILTLLCFGSNVLLCGTYVEAKLLMTIGERENWRIRGVPQGMPATGYPMSRPAVQFLYSGRVHDQISQR